MIAASCYCSFPWRWTPYVTDRATFAKETNYLINRTMNELVCYKSNKFTSNLPFGWLSMSMEIEMKKDDEEEEEDWQNFHVDHTNK